MRTCQSLTAPHEWLLSEQLQAQMLQNEHFHVVRAVTVVDIKSNAN